MSTAPTWIAGGGVICGIGQQVRECLQAFAHMQPGMARMQVLHSAHAAQFPVVEVKADNHTPVREVVLPYTQAKHEATRQTLQSITSAMAVEEDYDLPDNQLCPDKFCAYRSICGIDATLN